jgi:hypothetical protein
LKPELRKRFGLSRAHDPDLAPDPNDPAVSGKDQDHEQELKLSTFAGGESW